MFCFMWPTCSRCQHLLFHVADVQPLSASSVSCGWCAAVVSIFCFIWATYSLCQHLLFYVADVHTLSASSVLCGRRAAFVSMFCFVWVTYSRCQHVLFRVACGSSEGALWLGGFIVDNRNTDQCDFWSCRIYLVGLSFLISGNKNRCLALLQRKEDYAEKTEKARRQKGKER